MASHSGRLTSESHSSSAAAPSDSWGHSAWHVGPRYSLRTFLGKGSYGEVAEAFDVQLQCRVAIKRLSRIFAHEVDARRLLREVYLLTRLRHPNVIHLRDIVYAPAEAVMAGGDPSAPVFAASPSAGSDSHAARMLPVDVTAEQTPGSISSRGGGDAAAAHDELYLVFDFLDTDMHKLVISNQFLTPLHIQTFTYRLLCGLKYLHSARIIHRDLKPANVLINEDCSVAICDFGLARVLPPLEAATGPVLRPDTADTVADDASDISSAITSVSNARAGVKRGRGDDTDATPQSAQSVAPDDTQDDRVRKRAMPGHGTPHSAASFVLPDGTRVDGAALAAPAPRSSSSDVSSSSSPPTTVRRTMTRHVVTRFYRAPELILLQDYSLAVDMWSVGCILAELLFMEKGSVADFRDRKPLFPGRTCFPLSADHFTNYKDRLDQLNVIFNVIGTPSEADIAACDAEVQPYLRKLVQRGPTPLAVKFPAAPAPALDLLARLITFNPASRMTVDEALEHPFFTPVRDPAAEVTADASSLRIDPSVTESDISIATLAGRLRDEVVAFKRSLTLALAVTEPQSASEAAASHAAVPATA